MSIASEAKDDLLGYEIVKDGKVIGFYYIWNLYRFRGN